MAPNPRPQPPPLVPRTASCFQNAPWGWGVSGGGVSLAGRRGRGGAEPPGARGAEGAGRGRAAQRGTYIVGVDLEFLVVDLPNIHHCGHNGLTGIRI